MQSVSTHAYIIPSSCCNFSHLKKRIKIPTNSISIYRHGLKHIVIQFLHIQLLKKKKEKKKTWKQEHTCTWSADNLMGEWTSAVLGSIPAKVNTPDSEKCGGFGPIFLQNRSMLKVSPLKSYPMQASVSTRTCNMKIPDFFGGSWSECVTFKRLTYEWNLL